MLGIVLGDHLVYSVRGTGRRGEHSSFFITLAAVFSINKHMKLHQILEAKYHQDEGQIELTQARGIRTGAEKKKFEKMVSDAWHRGVLYKGENVFDQIYGGDLVKFLQNQLFDEIKQRHDARGVDGQESYLGYVPSEDAFVMGWDIWAETRNDYYDAWGDDDAEEGDEYEEDHVENMIMFELRCASPGNCGPEDWDVLDIPAGMMYGRQAGIDHLHDQYPDIIDVRLD